MSNPLMHAILFERYGARLSAEKLDEALGITKAALYNQISGETCPVKTYLDWASAGQTIGTCRSTLRPLPRQGGVTLKS